MSSELTKYRLLTRSDFDGLVCAVLLKEMGILGEIKFVHPKDVQDGKIEVTDHDILANLPYVPGCYMCFDHHDSEEKRLGCSYENHILEAHAKSAARVVYNHFGGRERFPEISTNMMYAVDKADSADFSREDILDPQGWDLLSFLMDARTGLGRFREFRVSNYQLMMDLIEHCKEHTIEEILELPDVKERGELYNEQGGKFIEQVQRRSEVHGNLVVLNLKEEETIYCGNRFLIYALFPQCNISMHVLWGLRQQNTVYTIGKSIFDRTCTTNIGDLCLEYEGGGHANAGTCQIANEDADRVRNELISRINQDAGIFAGV
ncbi:MAG: nanoRNase/pAp phosphatase (c-di-AMP/oligoRNAs hydrolase) [Pirellulaceae bacterium]|jgi:nanoRNase/pAp phosphatase (c-di-AMP/oligoRNAs hydrolase)